MKVKLPYGKSFLRIKVPKNSDVLLPVPASAIKDINKYAHTALSATGEYNTIRKMLKPYSSIAIIVNDITRPTPTRDIISWLHELLSGIPDPQVKIVIATGSHRSNTVDELRAMLGNDIVSRFKIINHDAFDDATLLYAGKTTTGAPVYLNRDYCEADIRIVTGFIEPHFFAGFSGGPKSIMPGIAGIESIMHFHNATRIDHPKSTWGVLEDNPVQDMAVETAMMMKPHLSVNVALNSRKEITGIFAGDVIASHRKGAEFVSKHAMLQCSGNYDLVITTNSGYPLDQSLYQSVKGMSAAAGIVKKGGIILCVAECSDGIPDHGEFGQMLTESRAPLDLLSMIRQDGYSRYDQWQAQALCKILDKASVYLYSSLPPETVKNVHLSPCDNVQNCIDTILSKHDDYSVAVLPEGPMVIPYIE
ncbi:MAG: nickel-dependent lactate racemase [Spirochaetota bacterium]